MNKKPTTATKPERLRIERILDSLAYNDKWQKTTIIERINRENPNIDQLIGLLLIILHKHLYNAKPSYSFNISRGWNPALIRKHFKKLKILN